jgi:hypothetical protein
MPRRGRQVAFVIDPQNPATLYAGSVGVMKSTDALE